MLGTARLQVQSEGRLQCLRQRWDRRSAPRTQQDKDGRADSHCMITMSVPLSLSTSFKAFLICPTLGAGRRRRWGGCELPGTKTGEADESPLSRAGPETARSMRRERLAAHKQRRFRTQLPRAGPRQRNQRARAMENSKGESTPAMSGESALNFWRR